MENKLFVGGLPYEATQDEVTKLFAACGTVSDVKIIMDRDTGRSKGFGFVEMSSEAEARAAIAKLNGAAMGERKIFITIAKPLEKRSEGAPAASGAGPAAKPGFVERRSGRDRRAPGGFGAPKIAGGERRESFGERKPWAEKKPWGEKKPWADKKPFGDRKPWADKPGASGEKKPWADKKPFGDKKPWVGKPSFGPKKFGKPGGGYKGKRGGFKRD